MNPSVLNRRRKASILVAEDEAIVRADVEDYLKSFGYHLAASVATSEEAKRQASHLKPDLVLMDIVLAGKGNGIEAARYIQRKLNIPVVFVTAHGDEDTLERAKLSAPFGYVLKPFNDRELRTAIEIALFRHRTEEDLRRLQRWLEAILDNMDEAVVVTDKWGFISHFNQRAGALARWDGKKVIGKPLNQVVQLLDSKNRQPVLTALHELALQPVSNGDNGKIILVPDKGPEALVRYSASVMTDSGGEVTGIILKFR